MIKDVCFNDLDCFSGDLCGEVLGPPENRLRGKLWRRLEGAVLIANNGAVHREQTKASGCGERSTRDFGRKRHGLKMSVVERFGIIGDNVLYHSLSGVSTRNRKNAELGIFYEMPSTIKCGVN
jgi:hypothetical protein